MQLKGSGVSYMAVVSVGITLALVLVAGAAVGLQGDGFDDAEPIEEGETQAEIVDGESDFYQLEANDTDALDVRLSPDDERLEFRIYDANRQVVVEDNLVRPGNTGRLTIKLPETGTYYLEVNGRSDQSTTPYTLNFDVVTPEENDQFAPNDGFDSAAPIEQEFSDATVWGGESDFYSVEVNGTDALDVRLSPDDERLEFRIYDGDQEVLAEDNLVRPGNTDRLTVDVPVTDTYYIEVSGRNDQSTTDYTLQSNQTGDFGDSNTPPTADAGSDQTVEEGETVTLDATGSDDPDGDSLTYSWTQTSGPDVSLTDADTITPEFTVPEVDSETDLTFEVTVDDGQATDTDTTTVTVTDSGADGPPPLPGQDDPPQDLDDDGLYEDVNGDGSFTIADVQIFFQNRGSDAVQNNPEAFNFDENEPPGVTIGDVQVLFIDFTQSD